MANTSSIAYTWNIAQLERELSDGYVFTAHYTVNATDGINSTGSYGSVGFVRPPEDQLIPYEELTEELVVGWVQLALGGEEKVVEIETALKNEIEQKENPTTSQGLPWNS